MPIDRQTDRYVVDRKVGVWVDERTDGWILTATGFTPGGSVKVKYIQSEVLEA